MTPEKFLASLESQVLYSVIGLIASLRLFVKVLGGDICAHPESVADGTSCFLTCRSRARLIALLTVVDLKVRTTKGYLHLGWRWGWGCGLENLTQ